MAVTFQSQTIQDWYDDYISSTTSTLGTDMESLDERVASFEYAIIDSEDSGEDTWDYPFDRDGLKRQFLNELIGLMLAYSGWTNYASTNLYYASDAQDTSNQEVFDLSVSSPGTPPPNSLSDYNLNTFADAGYDPSDYYLNTNGQTIYDNYSTFIDMVFEAGDELANDPDDPATDATADVHIATAIEPFKYNGLTYDKMSIDERNNKVFIASTAPMSDVEKSYVYDTGGDQVDVELAFDVDDTSTTYLYYSYDTFTRDYTSDDVYTGTAATYLMTVGSTTISDNDKIYSSGSVTFIYRDFTDQWYQVTQTGTSGSTPVYSGTLLTTSSADLTIDNVYYDLQFTDSNGDTWYADENRNQVATDPTLELFDVGDNGYSFDVSDDLSTVSVYRYGAFEGSAEIEEIDDETVEGVDVSYRFTYELAGVSSFDGSYHYLTSDGKTLVLPSFDRVETIDYPYSEGDTSYDTYRGVANGSEYRFDNPGDSIYKFRLVSTNTYASDADGNQYTLSDVSMLIDGSTYTKSFTDGKGQVWYTTSNRSKLATANVFEGSASGSNYFYNNPLETGYSYTLGSSNVTQTYNSANTTLSYTSVSVTIDGESYSKSFTDSGGQSWYATSDLTKIAKGEAYATEGSARRNLSPMNYLYYWMEARVHVLKGQLAYREAIVRELQEDITQANSALADLEDMVGDVETDDSDSSLETATLDIFELVNSQPSDPLMDTNGTNDTHNYTEWQENRTNLNNFIDTRTAQAEDAMLDYQQMLTRYNTAFETMSEIMDKMNTILESQIGNI